MTFEEQYNDLSLMARNKADKKFKESGIDKTALIKAIAETCFGKNREFQENSLWQIFIIPGRLNEPAHRALRESYNGFITSK